MVIDVSPVHPSNALDPMDVTESGIMIDTKLVQFEKAFDFIQVTESGTEYDDPSLPAGYCTSVLRSFVNNTPSTVQ